MNFYDYYFECIKAYSVDNILKPIIHFFIERYSGFLINKSSQHLYNSVFNDNEFVLLFGLFIELKVHH